MAAVIVEALPDNLLDQRMLSCADARVGPVGSKTRQLNTPRRVAVDKLPFHSVSV